MVGFVFNQLVVIIRFAAMTVCFHIFISYSKDSTSF